jgi:hypothetical protein
MERNLERVSCVWFYLDLNYCRRNGGVYSVGCIRIGFFRLVGISLVDFCGNCNVDFLEVLRCCEGNFPFDKRSFYVFYDF